MNPHNDWDRVGYLSGLADAVRALVAVAVARAREADLRALRQVPHQLGSAKAEVLLDRSAELDSLAQAARAQFRDAVAGRCADRAGQSGRAAVAARAQQMAADALETYRHAAHTQASWNREPRSLSRSDAVSDVTEHASAEDARATDDSDSDSNDRGSDGSGSGAGGIGTDDDSVPPWQDDAAAGTPDRSAPLANWPLWQDAQRIRDPDLVEFSGVVDQVVAEAPDSDEWGRWFDENDSLTLIVDDVLEDRRRDTEYAAAGQDLCDTDDRADSATDLDDAGPPHTEPIAEPGVHDIAGEPTQEQAASPAVVPEPLEQARGTLDEIAGDLERDRWANGPWYDDRGDSAPGRGVLGDHGDGYGHDPDDGDNDRYDDGRDPW